MKSPNQKSDKKYESYVEHPRYGRGPRQTSLNPNPNDRNVRLHPNAVTIREIQARAELAGVKLPFFDQLARISPKDSARIPWTAITANPEKQNHPTVPVSHYYDIEKICRKCKRHFIFFAEEQKYWYETLQFPLDSDCVLCSSCRKKEQSLSRNRSTYERLVSAKTRDWKDNLKMAKSALTLVENGVFGTKIVQKIRRLLKTVPDSEKPNIGYEFLLHRLNSVEGRI
ncbi:MAG TPA: zinc-ribbon domain containing protein [Verrucomicrobiae bacterium]|nr:zinc-ribbon domain containing protein [Verrucomicrobiae bacterium]